MTIPSHAKFVINSPYPLKTSYRCSLRFTLILASLILLSSPSPIDILPSGILTPRFARGWSRLPKELKIAIVRYNVVVPYTIWPSNANSVMHDILFHYLHMTLKRASSSRKLFFNENAFMIMLLQEDLSMFRRLPPM